MRQTVIQYAAFGKNRSGEWKRLKMPRASKDDAKADIMSIKAWWPEIAEDFVDYKVMRRKLITIREEWEDEVCDLV
jgi:hypothetical protein